MITHHLYTGMRVLIRSLRHFRCQFRLSFLSFATRDSRGDKPHREYLY